MAAYENPAALAGAHGVGKFDQQERRDHIHDRNAIQALRCIVLRRQHCLAPDRARLIAEMHFGDTR